MEAYRGRFRPVVLSAPSDQDELLSRQRQAFADLDRDLQERDIVLIIAAGGDVTTVGSPDCVSDAEALRSRYDLAADRFCVLLIGKDGGVKLRSHEPVASQTLFELIDAMPMRQREIQERRR